MNDTLRSFKDTSLFILLLFPVVAIFLAGCLIIFTEWLLDYFGWKEIAFLYALGMVSAGFFWLSG